jgi:hypothetical protein
MCDKLKLYSSDDFDNVDTPIMFSRKFDEYGLKVWDGGTSSILIKHCPWCGEILPESKRDKWFKEIEKLGIDPWTADVPDKYNTDEWFRGRASS